MLIDTHCHLNFQAFNADLDDVVRRAKNCGVEKMIVPGTDLISSRRAVEIANQCPDTCFAVVGIHPHHAQDPNLPEIEKLRQELEKIIIDNKPASVPIKSELRRGKPASVSNDRGLRRGRIVGIGEIGLDFHEYQKTKYKNFKITNDLKNKQKELFLMQLRLGLIHNLPVIFHCREAWPDMIQTISAFAKAPRVKKATADKSNNSRIDRHSFSDGGHASPKSRFNRDEGGHDFPISNNYIKPTQRLRGVFHCFSGSTQDLQLLITMGYYIGFDGNITYSDNLTPLVKTTPLNRLLLETDSPYLTPIPYRGKRNEPAYLPLTAEAVAKIKATPLSEVIHLSTINAEELFSI